MWEGEEGRELKKLFKSQLFCHFFLRPFEEVPRGLTEPACSRAPQEGTAGKEPSLLPA